MIRCKFLKSLYISTSGPGSSVGIATGYGLNSPLIESRWGGEIFRTCPDHSWGLPSLLYNGYRVFPWGKEWPVRDADPSPPSSAVSHERVELYLYSPYGPYGLYRASVPVQGCTLLLPLYIYQSTRWRPLFVCAISRVVSCRLRTVHFLVHSQNVLCAMWWASSGFKYVIYHIACAVLTL